MHTNAANVRADGTEMGEYTTKTRAKEAINQNDTKNRELKEASTKRMKKQEE